MSKVALQSIKVYKVGSQSILNSVNFENEIRNRKVIIKLFRRFGCPLCRLEAKNLSSYKPLFDKLNTGLVGVGFDKDGLQEFKQGNFWNSDLYLDPERQLYNYFSTTRENSLSGLLRLAYPSTRKVLAQAKEQGLGGNLKGDGFQLGGTIILDEQGQTLYKFLQTQYNEYPDIKQMIHVLGGNKNLVKDSDQLHWSQMDIDKFNKEYNKKL